MSSTSPQQLARSVGVATPDTATVYNHNAQPHSAGSRRGREPPLRKVVVVGGGTAGWMSALMLANTSYGPRIEVTVIESPRVGTVGVGEGSTPWLRGFFDELGIDESEWMPACHATYKSGISFDGWSTRPGFEGYFHAFASMLDNMTMNQFIGNVHMRLNRIDVHAHPDRFFISRKLAFDCLAPRPRRSFPFDVWYGYHFDSALLGTFLHKKALERGVRHLSRHVEAVHRDERGDIASLQLAGDETLAADLFIDCTGFASLLLGKALQTPYVSYAQSLFNDAAVTMATPSDGPIMSRTISDALRHGWVWKIPLTNRHGNGYVFSTAYCTPEEAETELRTRLGLLDDETPARHLRMRVGRVTKHWNHNCVGVGLSQGFVEPLEATGLLLVQRTVGLLVEALEQGEIGETARDAFNAKVNTQFDGTRDYLVAHYKTNTRTDTDYWRDNAANTHLSEPLERLLRTWLASQPIIPGLKKGSFGQGYPTMSWYSLLAGMGLFPDAGEMRQPAPGENKNDLAAVDNLIERSAMNFTDHREFLSHIPERPKERSLQAYFW